MAPTASPRFHSTGVLPTSARPSTQDLVAAAQAAMDEAVDRFASYANSGMPSSGGECAVWRVRSIRSSASAAATAAPIIDPVGGPTGRCCFSTGLPTIHANKAHLACGYCPRYWGCARVLCRLAAAAAGAQAVHIHVHTAHAGGGARGILA